MARKYLSQPRGKYNKEKRKENLMIVRKYGYEYILVELPDRPKGLIPEFMGNIGFALKATRKIKRLF